VQLIRNRKDDQIDHEPSIADNLSDICELKQTEVPRSSWTKLKDERARGVIAARLDRLAYGLLGNVEPVGERRRAQ
jgi:hypothetical protein